MKTINNSIYKTHTYHKDKVFFISTIYRQSSAMCNNPPWYYETLVWEWDTEKRCRKEEILSEHNSSSPNRHFEICQMYYKHGKPIENEEE